MGYELCVGVGAVLQVNGGPAAGVSELLGFQRGLPDSQRRHAGKSVGSAGVPEWCVVCMFCAGEAICDPEGTEHLVFLCLFFLLLFYLIVVIEHRGAAFVPGDPRR